MLTLASIIKASRQMASFGERGTAGALDHLPARVQGRRDRNRGGSSETSAADQFTPARRWDDELKIFVRD